MATVRGTQQERPLEAEYGKDTVYERSNIRPVDEPDTEGGRGFKGWEYEEAQYTHLEYIKLLEQRRQDENTGIKLAMAELAEIIAGGEAND